MKRNPWFRFYSEALDDPKVQRLHPPLFKAWVGLLCLASEQGGHLPTVDDIAFRLRMSAHDAQQVLDELILAGLVDIGPDGRCTPHNWECRQFVSDQPGSSTDRVRRFRARRKAAAGVTVKRDVTLHETLKNVSCNANETPNRKRKPLKSHENSPDPVSCNADVTPPDQNQSQSLTPLPPRNRAAKGGQFEDVFGGKGKGPAGSVSVDARRKVARKLNIGDADPLVALFMAWPSCRSARDIDALFISVAARFYRDAPATVRAACIPLDGSTAGAVSDQLRATLARRPRHARTV